MSLTDTYLDALADVADDRRELASALVETFPNLGYSISWAMQSQRRKDAHRHNLVLGGIQYGFSTTSRTPSGVPTWRPDPDVVNGRSAPEPDVGWGA